MALSAWARRELADICGEDGVLDDPTHRRAYDRDGYALDAIACDAVVLPRTAQQVLAVVRWCRRHRVPYAARGAGTGLSGGCLTPSGGVQIGLARLRRILEIDPVDRIAVVEPGVVNAQLSRAAAAHGLLFAPDPSSQAACTIGGNFAENSGGPHTLKVGVTLPHVLGATVVSPDGDLVKLGGRSLPGPGVDLLALSVGGEGTLGIAVDLTVRLSPRPSAVATFLAVFETLDDAARTVSGLVARAIVPAAMELIDKVMLQAVEAAFSFGFPLDAGAVLIVEIDGARADLDHERGVVREVCREHAARELREARDEDERALLWKARKHAFGAIGRMAPNYATQDGVVPRGRVPDVVRAIGEAARRHGVTIGTVIHAGDGNIHPCILFDERDSGQVDAALAAAGEILVECIDMEGTPTGEHGIGMEKREFLSLLFGPQDLAAMADLRRAFDPAGLCNPGKVLPGSGGCPELRVAGRQVGL
jgi:glycolate oxidase